MNAFTLNLLHAAGGQERLFGLLAVVGLSTAAMLLGRGLRRRPAARHAVLLAGLVSCLAAPAVALGLALAGAKVIAWRVLPAAIDQKISTARPVIRADVGSIVPEGTASDAEPGSEPALAAADRSPADAPADSASPRTGRTGSPLAGHWEAGVVFGWLCGTGVLLALTVRAWWQVRSIRRMATPLTGQKELWRAVQRRLPGWSGTALPEILLSPHVRTPVALGILRPAILLPSGSIAGIADEELMDIVVHEAAHILRGDHLVLVAQAAGRCLFWPVPTIHWLNRQLEQAREEICDNYVLAGREPAGYGRTLLKVAQWASASPRLAATVGMVRPGRLEARVAGLLDQGRDRSVRLSRASLAAIGCLFLLSCVLVCGTRVAAETRESVPVVRSDLNHDHADGHDGDLKALGDPQPVLPTNEQGTRGGVPPKRAGNAPETIVGTLIWQGKPVSAGWTVRAFEGATLRDEQFQTDDRGQFRVPKAWRDADHFLSVVAYNKSGIGWFDFFVHQRADQGGQTPADGSFTITVLPWNRRLRGRLVDENNQPLKDVPVRIDTFNHPANLLASHWNERIVNGKRIVPEAVTDEDGAYELVVPDETVATAGVDHPDWMSERFPAAWHANDLGVKKVPRAAKVSGRVVHAGSGRPLAGARVGAQAINVTPSGSWGMARTDGQGRYTIGGLAAGQFNVVFYDCPNKSLTAVAHAGVALTSGETVTADFAIEKGRRLTGRVVDAASGEAIAHCSVSYYGPARPRTSGVNLTTQTDANGRFEFFVPPGASHIYVSDERETVVESSRDVEVRAEGEFETIVLKAGAKPEKPRMRILLSKPVDRKISVKADKLKLAEFLAAVSNQAGLELALDEEGVASVVPADFTVTAEAREEALGPLLKRLFGPAKLDFAVLGRKLHVSSAERIRALQKPE